MNVLGGCMVSRVSGSNPGEHESKVNRKPNVKIKKKSEVPFSSVGNEQIYPCVHTFFIYTYRTPKRQDLGINDDID
jgi:hypothetical protein